jgi:hypothetical protein
MFFFKLARWFLPDKLRETKEKQKENFLHVIQI